MLQNELVICVAGNILNLTREYRQGICSREEKLLFSVLQKQKFSISLTGVTFRTTYVEMKAELYSLFVRRRRRAMSSLILFKTLTKCHKSKMKISKHHGKCLHTPNPFFCWFHTISVKTQKHMGSMPGKNSAP